MLKKTAVVLRQSCDPDVVIARTGGDEFVVLLPGTSEVAAQELCHTIEAGCANLDDSVRPSLALGTATKTAPAQSMQETVTLAEDRMYRRKLTSVNSRRSALTASLQQTLIEKSHETEAHARRLQQLSIDLVWATDTSEALAGDLFLLALLHDVGKIGIPEQILKKPGPLTEQEWETMKKHPEIGYRIVIASPDLAAIANFILYHHERWDGLGYPSGLKGDEIPLPSRILAIVDAFDAMTAGRSYRRSKTPEEALEEILACAGTQFDPELATAFVAMMKQ